jgi:hypothetical protein
MDYSKESFPSEAYMLAAKSRPKKKKKKKKSHFSLDKPMMQTSNIYRIINLPSPSRPAEQYTSTLKQMILDLPYKLKPYRISIIILL